MKGGLGGCKREHSFQTNSVAIKSICVIKQFSIVPSSGRDINTHFFCTFIFIAFAFAFLYEAPMSPDVLICGAMIKLNALYMAIYLAARSIRPNKGLKIDCKI